MCISAKKMQSVFVQKQQALTQQMTYSPNTGYYNQISS